MMHAFKMVRQALCLLAVGAVALATADEGKVIRFKTTGTLDWNDPANWEGDAVPTENDSVYLGSVGGSGTEYLWPQFPPDARAVDTIVGASENMSWCPPWSGQRGDLLGVRAFGPWSRIIRPIGFYAWGNRRAQCGLELRGTPEEPTILPNYFGGYAPSLRVPEGKAAEVKYLYNRGVFYKEGEGALTVDTPIDENIDLMHQGGTLTLKGGANASAAGEVAPGAYLHLNAAQEDTLETQTGTDTVIAWRDPTSGNAARPISDAWKDGWTAVTDLPTPTLDRAYCVNGHPLVRFGGILAWPEMRRDVREIFMVVAAVPGSTDSNDVMMPVGCHGWTTRNCHLNRYFNWSALADNSLINGYAATAVTNAEITVNGSPVPWYGYLSDPNELRVISISYEDNRTASIFGADRNVGAFGAFHAAEFVIYTNALTAVQRRETIAALKRRWLGDGLVHDVGVLRVDSDTAKIGVPAGEAVSVRTVNDLSAHGIVKTGEGTLVLDRVQPATAHIEVQGGAVAFNRQTALSAAEIQVADNPLFHLDADNADSLTVNGGVTSWHDTRANVDFAANLPAGSDKPTVVAASPTGKNVVDFANRHDVTAPKLLFSANQKVFEGFIVWKNIYSGTAWDKCPAIFGSQTFPDFSYNDPSKLYNQYRNSSSPIMESAVWTVNGIVVKPESSEFGDKFGAGVSNFVVIHFAATQPATMAGVADGYSRDAGTPVWGGGCQVAEFIGYDRLLTDKERRATEAALMKKWLGVDHPDQKGWTGTIAFADGVTPEVASETDLTLGQVAANGPLVKSGAGALKVLSLAGIEGYEVRGGSLAVEEDPMSDAYFHVDASAEGSLEYKIGTTKGELAKWHDVRGNGRYAEALVTDVGNREDLLKYPQIGSDAVRGLAEGMPYVDFLHYSRTPSTAGTGPSYENEDTASMRWVDENGIAGMQSDIREVHIVYVDDIERYDAGTLNGPGSFLGSWNWPNGTLSYTHQFTRGGIGSSIFYYCTYTQTANMRMDGEDLPRVNGNGDNYICGGNNMHAHVLSIASTGEPMEANAFCNDRGNCGAGGYKICEVVVFTGKTNTTEKFSAINDYLCKKWRGIGAGTAFPSSGSLRATGGTLKLSSATGAVAPKDGANLEFAFKDADDYGKIEVTGDFVVPENGTISVTLPQKGEPKPTPGEYVLFQADRFVNAENFANWTVTAETNGRFASNVRIDAENGKIILTISKIGYSVIIR